MLYWTINTMYNLNDITSRWFLNDIEIFWFFRIYLPSFFLLFLRKQNNFSLSLSLSVEDKKTYSRKGLLVLSLFSSSRVPVLWSNDVGGSLFCKRCIKQIEALVIWYACTYSIHSFSNKIINYSCSQIAKWSLYVRAMDDR